MITASVKQQKALDASSQEGVCDLTGLESSRYDFSREGRVLTTVYPPLRLEGWVFVATRYLSLG